jgi:hypothetical protein
MRLAWVPVAIGIPTLALLAAQRLQQDLERRARDLDLGKTVREAGLPGQVVSADWKRSTFSPFPRPALVLDDVEIRLLSGRPGPGRWAGRLTCAKVRLVPRWNHLAGRSLERIEAWGGVLEIGSDLLPQLPRLYDDPIENGQRPVPWAALLAVAADSSDALEDPWSGAEAYGGSGHASAGAGGVPRVGIRDLEIRLAALDFLPGTELHLERARFLMTGERMEVTGVLLTSTAGRKALAIPLRIQRLGRGTASNWEAKVGRPGLGWEFHLMPATKEPREWSLKLDDPAGKLASTLLEGRTGVLQHLRWSGPCQVRANGTGRFPGGLAETRIDLLSGRLFADVPKPMASLIARGSLEVRPGRVDLSALTLRSAQSPADSAIFHFEWLRTLRGRSMRGSLQGHLDPAWLALAGSEWKAAGALSCNLSFEGKYAEDARGWTVMPRGRVEGSLDSLTSPWFADTLRAGRFSAWGERGKIRLILVGRWGESPFRLEARGLPPPAPGYLDLVSTDGEWNLSAPWARLEDFRLAPGRFPHLGSLPFWLGLPGSGTVNIDRGTCAGVPFDSLVARTFRSRDVGELDSLNLRMAGGRVWSGPSLLDPVERWGRRRGGVDIRICAEDVDLATVQRLLRGNGVRLRGDYRGSLSGAFRVHWAGPSPNEISGCEIEASIHARDGSIRGLPAQEALRHSLRVDQLAVLTYQDWSMELHQGPDGLSWNRLRVEAPPLRIEGAGHAGPDDALQAVLMVQVRPEGGQDALSSLLLSLVGEGKTSIYAILGGATSAPSLQVVSRSTFMQELDRLGGSLPLSGPLIMRSNDRHQRSRSSR